MPSLLKQLENNDSLLLMYLSGELPMGDRTEVERRLASDPALRQALEDLRGAQASVNELLRADDASTPLPVSSAVAVRHVSRSIRQWQVDRFTAPPADVAPARGLRYPWWIYPTTSVAALLIAFLVWWGNWGHDRRGPEQLAKTTVEIVEPDTDEIAELTESMTGNEEHVAELTSIDDAANELASISQGSDEIRDMFDSISEEGI